MTADDLERSERALSGAAQGEAAADDAVAELLGALVGGVDDVPAPEPGFLASLATAALDGAVDAPGAGARRLLPVLLLGGSLLFGGVAAAANGSLPGPIQDAVHDVADAVGIDIPAADASDDPGNRGGVEGIGEDGTPPGQGGTVPGNGNDGGGNGVGQDGTPPGQGGTVPGNGNDGGGNGVGNGGTPPGNDGNSGGNGVGNDGTPPSNDGNAGGNGVGPDGTPPSNDGNAGGNGQGGQGGQGDQGQDDDGDG